MVLQDLESPPSAVVLLATARAIFACDAVSVLKRREALLVAGLIFFANFLLFREKVVPTAEALADAQMEAQRYSQVVDRLRRLLEGERRAVRETRAHHMRLVQEKTELEEMLREAVDQVKSELGLSNDPSNLSEIKMLTKKQREGVLEMLLSQERTIILLYDQDEGKSNGAQTRGGAGIDQSTRMIDDERQSYADSLREMDDDDDV